MKAVTKYQADDGCLFDTVEDAQRRDGLASRLQYINRKLGPRVSEWDQRKQHDLAKFQEFKRDLVGVCKDLFAGEPCFNGDALTIHPFSYAGRFIDEAGPGVLRDAWQRLMCITAEGMEYSQPFFALNPDQWKA